MKSGDLHLQDCINETCPWSGKPVRADALTLYQGHVVGFCNPGLPGQVRAGDHAVREGARRCGTPAKARLTGQGRWQIAPSGKQPLERADAGHLAFARVPGG